MQNELTTSSAAPVALTGRSVDEITADIRVNYRNAKTSIIQIGRDLAEVKQLLQHGEWLPYLQGLNISVSSAENYMRYAAEVPGDKQLAALPYSAAMALIALPADQRQEVEQQGIDGKSAAEIKRLIAEVKAEKKRADAAEQAAKDAQRAAETSAQTLKSVQSELKQTQDELSERPVIKETVTPEDYDDLKDAVEKLHEQLIEAEDAAADAEERANAAVAQAQRAAMQQLDDEDDLDGPDGRPTLVDFIGICNDFQSQVWAVPFMADTFRTFSTDDLNAYRLYINGIKSWAERSLAAMDEAAAPLPAEGVVIIDADE